MALFGFGRSRVSDGRREQVAAWARAAGGFGPDIVVKANEIVCPDPACPGFETIILIQEPGKRSRAVKIVKPIAAVTEADVAAAFHNG